MISVSYMHKALFCFELIQFTLTQMILCFQTTSIQKAISADECAAKEKHVRSRFDLKK